jgi:DNA polymerase-4
MWMKANGQGNDLLTIAREQKSISKENTFDKDITDKEIIRQTIFGLTAPVCQDLRDLNWLASTIHIKLRYSDFQTLTRSKSIEPTADDKIVYETAWKILEKNITRRVGIRLVGVGVSNFVPYSEQQLLFDDDESKRKRMLDAVNQIRNKFGFDYIKLGIENK